MRPRSRATTRRRRRMPRLRAAYMATRYVVVGEPAETFRLHDVAGAHDHWLQPHATSLVIVTAWNPFSERQPAFANAIAQRRLHAAIRKRRLRHLAAVGFAATQDWYEDSFCVFNAPPALLRAWLLAFRQYAALRVRLRGTAELVWHPHVR